ncbi:hypothetical protein UY3_13666 [Chelonia mydas]|uniref:Zinc finger and SCAN domain-containing protein 29 n=1 Tax=Chelonia mydas TaxID=8469 RepID=M7AUU5_CHEMY|nr:hypothetical protein UY3_13666 [Chelonia mydas]
MTERGHDRDTLQCRVKVKELCKAYKLWEANCCSGAVPTSCQFYKELDAILGGDHTSSVKTTVDTSVAHVPVKRGPSQEEEILDEDVEGDPEAEDNSEVRDACSQQFIPTPEKASQSQLPDLGETQTGEEASEKGQHLTKRAEAQSSSRHASALELLKIVICSSEGQGPDDVIG